MKLPRWFVEVQKELFTFLVQVDDWAVFLYVNHGEGCFARILNEDGLCAVNSRIIVILRFLFNIETHS